MRTPREQTYKSGDVIVDRLSPGGAATAWPRAPARPQPRRHCDVTVIRVLPVAVLVLDGQAARDVDLWQRPTGAEGLAGRTKVDEVSIGPLGPMMTSSPCNPGVALVFSSPLCVVAFADFTDLLTSHRAC